MCPYSYSRTYLQGDVSVRHAALLKLDYADDVPRAAVAFDVLSPGRVARVVDIGARRAPRCPSEESRTQGFGLVMEDATHDTWIVVG